MSKRSIALARATCIALALLAQASAGAAEDAGKPRVVAFNANVRVEVDAAGKPLRVEAPADLPEAIRSFIEKRVASWQYEPAKQDGIPTSAVTFVQVGACALPVAEGFRLGLDFKGNGPAIVDAGPWFLPPPRYPQDMQRSGGEGSFQVSYSIQVDGTTKLGAIKPLDVNAVRHLKGFRGALASWVEDLRYQPERVNGVPVVTEMSFPVDFSLRIGPSKRSYREELERHALMSKECIAASAPAGPLPVAQNSPVKVNPVPAG